MKIAIKTETTKRNQLEILGGEKYNNWTENFMRAIQQQTWVQRRKNQWNWRQFIRNHWVRGRNGKKKEWRQVKKSEESLWGAIKKIVINMMGIQEEERDRDVNTRTGDQSQGKDCCWLQGDGPSEWGGGVHSGECLWSKSGQPWRQGATTESCAGGGAITVWSPHTGTSSWPIEKDHRESGPLSAWCTKQ